MAVKIRRSRDWPSAGMIEKKVGFWLVLREFPLADDGLLFLTRFVLSAWRRW